MGDNPVDRRGGKACQEAFLARLYRQAGRRWLMLAGAVAILLWLGVFAGHLRNPDAVKRPWAVLVSRILLGAGGFFLVRLLLFSYEERVPVLCFDLRSERGAGGRVERIGNVVRDLKHRGYQTVPLGDVVEFVREQRYVPKKCFGLVVEAGDIEDLSEIGAALPDTDLIVLLPPSAVETGAAASRLSGLTSGISIGLSLAGKDSPKDTEDLRALLDGFRGRIASLTGGEPGFARVGPLPGVDLRGLLKDTAYTCFLDGKGLNRFGDEPHMLRLLDATAVVTAGKGGKELAMYIGLFKGRHYLWPVAAMMRLIGRGSGGV